MIDIENAKKVFKEFLEPYKNLPNQTGFDVKVQHTYRVTEMSKKLAQKLKLSDEDVQLAELIGLLHDIGRFEELKVLNRFDGVKFDHAECGVKMLFEDGLIKKFVEDEKYYHIIEKAIGNHSKLKIEENLDEKELLHSKIIRDSDKLDNYRIKSKDSSERLFSGIVHNTEEFENSKISPEVMNSVRNLECVKNSDRKEPLDYYISATAFIFDLYFKESIEIVKEKDYINCMIDRFNYKLPETKANMEEIRQILNNYLNNKLKNLHTV